MSDPVETLAYWFHDGGTWRVVRENGVVRLEQLEDGLNWRGVVLVKTLEALVAGILAAKEMP